MKGLRARESAAVLALLALTACEEVEQVQDRFRDLTPHEAYESSLAAAGLTETALGRDWLRAGRSAVEAAAPVSLPFEEQGYIAPEAPGAIAYRMSVARGQRLTAEVTVSTDEGTRVFVDLFRQPENAGDPPRPIASTDSLPGQFVHEPWRDGEFILRLQPELLRGGHYTVSLRLEAQLAFPVAGYNVRAVQSVFGAPRDAGRRSHHGVDIFARRGTPVLAAAPGRVRRVQVTALGGKVVWLRDPVRNTNLYYAHLDSQAVVVGQDVQIGDTLGFVGNTGNARTTPPHLHFGVYVRGQGPVDPYPYLNPPSSVIAELEADLTRLGQWVRLTDDAVRLRAAPGSRAPVIRELPRHTALRVLGGSGQYFRVRLPDGGKGYVAARMTEPLDLPVSSEVAAAGGLVFMRPDQAAPIVATLGEGDQVPVLGRYGEYLYVRAPSGFVGWMDAAAQQD
jgi:murein DD-endopeptidase MepM/ murein hydrolase activator NlpD